MKACVMTGIRKVEFQERRIPEIKPDEVLIKILDCGVCGSDVHYYQHGRIGNYVVDTSVEGEYYIIYTIDDIKYGNIQKVRTISILPTESSIDNQSTEVENG